MSHPTISQAAIMAIVALAVWMSGGRRVVRNAERTPIAVRLSRDKTQPCPPCCSPRSAHQPQRQDPSGTTGAGGDVHRAQLAPEFLLVELPEPETAFATNPRRSIFCPPAPSFFPSRVRSRSMRD